MLILFGSLGGVGSLPALAENVYWNNPAGGNWTMGSNWSTGSPPGPGDTARIELAGTYTVTLNTNTQIERLVMGPASGTRTLIVDGAVLSISGSIDGPSLVGASCVLDVRGSSTLQGAELENYGSAYIRGTSSIQLNLANHALVDLRQTPQIVGSFSNKASGTVQVIGGDYLHTHPTFTNGFVNEGQIWIAVYGGDSLPDTAHLTVTNGTLVNAPGATIRNVKGGIWDQFGNRTLTAQIDNQGLIDIVDWPLAINKPGAQHINSGTISLQGSNLTITQSGASPSLSNMGTIEVGAGRTLSVTGGTFSHFPGADLDLSGGTLSLSSLTLHLLGDLTIDAGETLSLGSSTVNGPGELESNGAVVLFHATLAAALDNKGYLDLRGTSSINGAFANRSSGDIWIIGMDHHNAHATFANGFVNEGQITIGVYGSDSGPDTANMTVTSGTLVNAPGATIRNIKGGSGAQHDNRTLSAQIDNQGLIDIVDWPLIISKSGVQHINSGTIVLQQANLTITQSGTTPSITNTGTIDVGAGRTLSVSGGTFHNNAGAQLVLNGATLSCSSLTLNLHDDYTVSAGNTLSLSSSTLNGPGELENNGAVVLFHATLAAALDNKGYLDLRGISSINGAFANRSSGDIWIIGMDYHNAHATFANGFVNEGQITIGVYGSDSGPETAHMTVTSGTLVNAPGATIRNIQGGLGAQHDNRTLSAQIDNQGLIDIVSWPLNLNKAGAQHVNSGTISLQGSNLTITQSGASPSFTNTGTINIASSRTLTVTGGSLTQTAGELRMGGASSQLTVSGGWFFTMSGGLLSGSGLVNANLINSGGVVSPGSSPGLLTVGGSYTQGPGATLVMEVGGATPGTQHDRLNVGGTATLAGTLDVQLINGFSPAPTAQFVLVSAGTRSGTFASVIPCDHTVIYTSTTAAVQFDEAPIITTHPAEPASAEVGGTVQLTVSATGGTGLSYQWRLDGQDLSDGPTGHGSTISGSDSDTLTITNAQLDDSGAYDCVVSDDCGLVESDPADVDVVDAECATIALTTNTSLCYTASNTTLVVDIELGSACSAIVGGQFYLTYDTSKLDLLEEDIEAGQAPFTQLILANVDDAAGTADVAVSVPVNTAGVTSGRMARLTFTITADICTPTAELVSFRAHVPPTRVVDLDLNAYDVNNGELLVVPLPAISADVHPPVIADPGVLSLECGPTNAAAIADWLALAIASDDCGISSSGHDFSSLDITCGNSGSATVTFSASDACGNVTTLVRTVTVTDTTPPGFTSSPAALTLECADAGNEAAIANWLASAAAADSCGTVDVTHDYTALTPGACPGTGSATVTWTATDECGLSTQHVATVTVADTTPPLFVDANAIDVLPAISTIADAGLCTALISVPIPIVVEDCDANVTLEGVRSDSLPLGSPFSSAAPTTITWTATDCAGNVSVATQVVEVQGVNEIDVDIAYAGGGYAASMERCIRFEVFPDNCGAPVVVEQTVTFVHGVATGVVIQVPCGGYACITARDVKHSLRRTDLDDFGTNPIVGVRYAANFTNQSGSGGDNDALITGNYFQSGGEYVFIDILDLALLLSVYGLPAAVDTPCGFVGHHADADGDGVVGQTDLAVLLSAFGQIQEANCCGSGTLMNPPKQPGMTQGGMATPGTPNTRPALQPRLSITVAELIAMGHPELAAADRNGDGVVDLTDAEAIQTD